MRSFILAILVGAGLACDPCSAVAEWKAQECAQGNVQACDWIAKHQVAVGVPNPKCGV
jgi:hypothetical protein